jgi:hypothetical protein
MKSSNSENFIKVTVKFLQTHIYDNQREVMPLNEETNGTRILLSCRVKIKSNEGIKSQLKSKHT